MDLENEIQQIKDRNIRVEADKAWEKSVFRISVIASVTYVGACLLLFLIHVENFYVAGIVPVIGYLLSAQSLPPLKRWWIQTFWKKSNNSSSAN